MRPHSVRMAAAYVLTRTFIGLLGLGAIAWGGFVLPLFWQQPPLNRVAAELLQGWTFKTQALLAEVQQADTAEQASVCNPTSLHNAVILRLAILDEAIAATNPSLIDSDYRAVYDAARRSLACLPADPFVWLTLFWLDATKHGVEPHNGNYLRLSYALGPNEGWIALWRTRIGVAQFERLPTDLSNHTIDDFIKLVDTGRLYSETVEIFMRASAVAQARILENLRTAHDIPRQTFARALYDEGVDVNVPGFNRPDRPWR